MRYRIFGLLLDCDVPLPELGRARGRSPDLVVRLRSAVRVPRAWKWIDRWDRDDGVPWLLIGRRDEGWLLRFPRLADFIVPARQGAIACRARADLPGRTIRHLLLDQVVPLALSARGHVLLHASAVSTAGTALLFAGPSGSGKSTLAFTLTNKRCRLLADDVVRLQVAARQVLATPAYPGARLWPDVLDAFRVADRGRQLAPYSPKRRVLSRQTAGGRSLPVARIYLLERASALEVRPVSPRAALVELLKQAYRLDVTDAAMERRHFETLASACSSVPVHALAYPRDFRALEQVASAVLVSPARHVAPGWKRTAGS